MISRILGFLGCFPVLCEFCGFLGYFGVFCHFKLRYWGFSSDFGVIFGDFGWFGLFWVDSVGFGCFVGFWV